MDASEEIVVLVTAGSRDEATRIAEALVTEQLAACVNLVGPIQSIYRWQGRVESAAEVLLIIKTRRARWTALAERVRALHSYETPEIIALPIIAGAPAYLEWLRTTTRS